MSRRLYLEPAPRGLSPPSLARLPQLRGIKGKPPNSNAGKRKEHAGGSTVRTSAARASLQRWAMEGWREGWWAGGLDTVSGGDTFALYRVRGRCCGRAQNPGHRPPHTLISTGILARPLHPASPASRKKSGQKSLTPHPRCNPIVSRLPLPLVPPGPLEGLKRLEVCRVATRLPAGIPRAVAILNGLTEVASWPLVCSNRLGPG